jgi:hypothetical protein
MGKAHPATYTHQQQATTVTDRITYYTEKRNKLKDEWSTKFISAWLSA